MAPSSFKNAPRQNETNMGWGEGGCNWHWDLMLCQAFDLESGVLIAGARLGPLKGLPYFRAFHEYICPNSLRLEAA